MFFQGGLIRSLACVLPTAPGLPLTKGATETSAARVATARPCHTAKQAAAREDTAVGGLAQVSPGRQAASATPGRDARASGNQTSPQDTFPDPPPARR